VKAFVPASPATIPRDLLEPLPKGTFSIGEMAEYDKYKTTHDSITFGPGNEDELREETDEQRAERYARYQQLWQKYLKDSDELLKMLLANGSHHLSNMNQLDMATLLKPTSLEGQHPYPAHVRSFAVVQKEVPLLARFASKDKLLLSRSLPVMPCSVSVWGILVINFRWLSRSAMP
jgi:hypothetical protein